MKNAWNAEGRIDMDERITPRSFAAGLPGDIPRHWLPGNEFVSSLLNAYTILVPANEAFYIRTLNACLPHVRDETLLGRCQDFIRQEAQHGVAHKRYGVGMIHLKLRQAGLLVNYKRVERLYQEAKLQVRRHRVGRRVRRRQHEHVHRQLYAWQAGTEPGGDLRVHLRGHREQGLLPARAGSTGQSGMAGKYYANSMKSGATVYNEGVPLVGEIGTLTKTAATSVGSKVFQGILKQKGLLRTVKDRRVYDLQLDWDKVEAEALRGGRSFNAELVARLE